MFANPLGTLTGKLFAGLIVLALLLGLFLSVKWDDAEQPKQDARSANASAVTAKEAAEIVIGNADESADIDQLVADAAKRIEDAPDAQTAAIEARSAMCSFAIYRDKPECSQ